MIQTIRNSILYVPLSIRRLAMINSTLLPFQLSRLGLYFALSPIGKEKKWIHKIKHDSWEGNWITPNLKNLQEVEQSTVKKDVIILYIHGKDSSLQSFSQIACLIDIPFPINVCCVRRRWILHRIFNHVYANFSTDHQLFAQGTWYSK